MFPGRLREPCVEPTIAAGPGIVLCQRVTATDPVGRSLALVTPSSADEC